MKLPAEVLLLGMAVLTATGQVFLRRGAVHLVRKRGLLRFLLSFINPHLITGSVLALAAPLLYIRALGGLPLSQAFMFNSLSHLLVFLAGRFVLKERAHPLHWIGLSLIILGFLMPIFVEGIL
jgi:drug/metabolite transporter (DMT)-like permease